MTYRLSRDRICWNTNSIYRIYIFEAIQKKKINSAQPAGWATKKNQTLQKSRNLHPQKTGLNQNLISKLTADLNLTKVYLDFLETIVQPIGL